jgi:hypothetical protein
MSMKIQGMLSSCYNGVKGFASSAISWVNKAGSTACNLVVDTTTKVAQFARPYFSRLTTSAQQNKTTILLGVAALAVGTVAITLINDLWCKNKDAGPDGRTPPPSGETGRPLSSTTPPGGGDPLPVPPSGMETPAV